METPRRRQKALLAGAAVVAAVAVVVAVALALRARPEPPLVTAPGAETGSVAPGASATPATPGPGAGVESASPAATGATPPSGSAASPTLPPPPPVSDPVCGEADGPAVSGAADGPRRFAWRSGASGAGVADGSFGRWRGTGVPIAGTWNDSLEAQTRQCTVLPGYEYGAWTGDLDVAVGAIYEDRGETWRDAARGAYDDRWRQALTTLRDAWGDRPGTLHIRFAHEFNGDWVPWAVHADEVGDFVTAWRRFRALQREILPGHLLVLCPNDASSASLGLDWRRAFPGTAYVDEMGVDAYNARDFTDDAAGFASNLDRVDSFGAPVGLEQHRRFAASVGLPLAVPEWSSDAEQGDAPAYVAAFHDWVRQHAGTGPGQVPYEILFNVAGFGDGKYEMYPETRQPRASAEYARLW